MKLSFLKIRPRGKKEAQGGGLFPNLTAGKKGAENNGGDNLELVGEYSKEIESLRKDNVR